MGAWGTGSFDNDDAMGLIRRVLGGEGLEPVRDHLRLAHATGALAADPGLGAIVLAAGELVAALWGAPADDLPEGVSEWLAAYAGELPGDLPGAAHRACEAVLARSRWAEQLAGDERRAAWRSGVEALCARLVAVAPPLEADAPEAAEAGRVLASELWEPTDPAVNPWVHALFARLPALGERLWFEADGLHTELTAPHPEEPDLTLTLVVSQGGLVTLGFGAYFEARFSIGEDADASERCVGGVGGVDGADLLAGILEGRSVILHYFVDDQLRRAVPVAVERLDAEIEGLFTGAGSLTTMERLKLRFGRSPTGLAVALSWTGAADRQVQRRIERSNN